MQRRPEFHNYPLNTQELSSLHQEKQIIEKDIKENLEEIRALNNKMAKNDYELTYLHRLKEREMMLNEKRREMDEILRTHEYLQGQVNISKQHDQQFRTTLASEYKQVIEEKKRKQLQDKRRRVEDEQHMLEYNQRMFQAEQERKRYQFQQAKREAQEQLAAKEQMKQREKEQRERQKAEYNRKVQIRNSLETQKQAVYKQYYSQFMDNQSRLQSVYEDKTAPQNQSKEEEMRNFLRKEQQEYAKLQNHQQEERVRRAMTDKQSLKNYLQYQMEEKEKRKSFEQEQRRSYNQQVASYQMSQKEYEQMEKQRKREEQRRYDEQLASQIRTRGSIHSTSSSPNQRMHNPITNPIDFKMGITNPYVIKEYEQTKQRFMGDRDLKLKNLAMIGNNSLVHH